MPSHDVPDPPSTEPPEQDVPNQRGTSSGEIGQNPVEIIGKKTVPPGDKSARDHEAKGEDSSKG